MKHLFKTLFLLFITAYGFSQNPRIIPRDESVKDSSLTVFINELRLAIKKKDKDFILNSVSPTVKNSFGNDDGIETFKKKWQLDAPQCQLWGNLEKLLNLGGTFVDDENTNMLFPSVFPYLRNIYNDTFSMAVVTSEKLMLREKPDKKSKTLGILSYDVAYLLYSDKFTPEYGFKPSWSYIRTLDKKMAGYVPEEYLYNPLQYRMFIAKRDGKWKITFLCNGR